jgi:hypothetical protein
MPSEKLCGTDQRTITAVRQVGNNPSSPVGLMIVCEPGNLEKRDVDQPMAWRGSFEMCLESREWSVLTKDDWASFTAVAERRLRTCPKRGSHESLKEVDTDWLGV